MRFLGEKGLALVVGSALTLSIAASGPLHGQGDDEQAQPDCTRYAIDGLSVGLSHRAVVRIIDEKPYAQHTIEGPNGPSTVVEYDRPSGALALEYVGTIQDRKSTGTIRLLREEIIPAGNGGPAPELLVSYGAPLRGGEHLDQGLTSGSVFWADRACGVMITAYHEPGDWWDGGNNRLWREIESIEAADADLLSRADARQQTRLTIAATVPAMSPAADDTPVAAGGAVTVANGSQADPRSSFTPANGSTADPDHSLAELVPARRTRYVAPVYPRAARASQTQRKVALNVEVLSSGAVGRIDIVNSTKDRMGFEAAAVAAVQQWIYEPATTDGRPIRSTTRVVINFQ